MLVSKIGKANFASVGFANTWSISTKIGQVLAEPTLGQI